MFVGGVTFKQTNKQKKVGEEMGSCGSSGGGQFCVVMTTSCAIRTIC